MNYHPVVQGAVDCLDGLLDRGSAACGAQLWAAHRGVVVCDVALGDSVTGLMTTETVHNHYCAAKPAMALTIATLTSMGALDPTRSLTSLDLPEWAVPPFDCTVLDVLDHQVGLDTLSAMEYRLAPEAARQAMVTERIAVATRRPAYSEILGGIILEEVVASATKTRPVADEIQRLVLKPLGIPGMALSGPQATPLANQGLPSVPFGGLPDRPMPLLFEMLPQSFNDIRPAFGVLASAKSLGMVLECARNAVGGEERGAFGDSISMLLTPRHEPFGDPHVDREVKLAGGFMVDARLNNLSRVASANSFGHNGGMAQTVSFADLDAGLTMSLYLNGAEMGDRTTVAERLDVVDELQVAVAGL